MLPVVGVEGRVVGEVELRVTDGGAAAARFRVKAADRRKNQDTGQWEDTDVLWVTASCFGKLAEHCAQSLHNGDQVVMIGRWSTAEWTDPLGNARSAPRFTAQAVGAGLQFAPRRHHDSAGAAAPAAQEAYAQPAAGAPAVSGFAGGPGAVDDPWG